MQRRTLISGLAALASAVSAGKLFAAAAGAEKPAAGSCRLTTLDVSGPYDIDKKHIRSDVVDGQKGVPLTLDFQVMNALGCTPVEGAVVTIWHANREGHYSGVENVMLTEDMRPEENVIDTTGQSFLRGVQTSDADGRVRFQTVFPGWYFPRATHLHVKVNPPDFGEEATTQLYFSNQVCDEVYAGEHYAHRGPNPMRTEPGQDDPIFASEAGDLWLNLQKDGDGFIASHELGVVFYGGMFGDLPDRYRQS